MRIIAAFALFAFIGCAAAEPRAHYDLYISEPGSGPELYAFAGAGHVAVVEVADCGHARLVENPATIVDLLRVRAQQPGVTRISIGRGSNTQIGMCDEGDNDTDKDEESDGDNEETIVVIEDISSSDLRRMLATFRAAPEPVRAELISTLGL